MHVIASVDKLYLNFRGFISMENIYLKLASHRQWHNITYHSNRSTDAIFFFSLISWRHRLHLTDLFRIFFFCSHSINLRCFFVLFLPSVSFFSFLANFNLRTLLLIVLPGYHVIATIHYDNVIASMVIETIHRESRDNVTTLKMDDLDVFPLHGTRLQTQKRKRKEHSSGKHGNIELCFTVSS